MWHVRLQRLERLLGVTGPNAKKKKAKLEKELEQEDGLGDDFGAFLAGLDRIGEVLTTHLSYSCGARTPWSLSAQKVLGYTY